MFGDYKYAMQMEAEEIAQEEYGVDFYDLPAEKQSEVYRRGMESYTDKIVSRADNAERSGAGAAGRTRVAG